MALTPEQRFVKEEELSVTEGRLSEYLARRNQILQDGSLSSTDSASILNLEELTRKEERNLEKIKRELSGIEEPNFSNGIAPFVPKFSAETALNGLPATGLDGNPAPFLDGIEPPLQKPQAGTERITKNEIEKPEPLTREERARQIINSKDDIMERVDNSAQELSNIEANEKKCADDAELLIQQVQLIQATHPCSQRAMNAIATQEYRNLSEQYTGPSDLPQRSTPPPEKRPSEPRPVKPEPPNINSDTPPLGEAFAKVGEGISSVGEQLSNNIATHMLTRTMEREPIQSLTVNNVLIPSSRVEKNLVSLSQNLLEPLGQILGAFRPELRIPFGRQFQGYRGLTIISGLRTPDTNRGSITSDHLWGAAVDLKFGFNGEYLDTQDMAELIIKNNLPFTRITVYNDFIHVSNFTDDNTFNGVFPDKQPSNRYLSYDKDYRGNKRLGIYGFVTETSVNT